MAATTQVLDTVELLEQILWRLPMRELLTKQVVSRTWYDCIGGSVALQQHLFRSPLPREHTPEKTQLLHYIAQPVLVNPLMSGEFRFQQTGQNHSNISLQHMTKPKLFEDDATLSHEPQFEDVLRTTSSGLEDYPHRALRLVQPDYYSIDRPAKNTSNGDFRDLLHHRGFDGASHPPSYTLGSWSSLLLTQPPLPSIIIQCKGCSPWLPTVKVIAADGVGVRLGELMKAADELCGPLGSGWDERVNEQLNLLQPVGDLRFPASFDGRRLARVDSEEGFSHHCERLGFVRAWKSSLRIVIAE
ncbi:hypothetical protein LTR08_000806 [Meristemomyces frigidus]|nr:hypothetical protein LTR08_000806 [Meristemomyces frigidus]